MIFTSLWCGMDGPARPFPQVGIAVADTRFSCSAASVVRVRDQPVPERQAGNDGHHPEDDGQDPQRPGKTLHPGNGVRNRRPGTSVQAPPSARRPPDGARPTRTSSPIRRSITRPSIGAASRAGAFALGSNRWRASAAMSLWHSPLQRRA